MKILLTFFFTPTILLIYLLPIGLIGNKRLAINLVKYIYLLGARIAEDKKTFLVVKTKPKDEINKIEELIADIKFGSVTIHVEDGKIIQVDKNEKIRLR